MPTRWVIAVVAAMAIGGAARAEPTFDLFQEICLKTGGDRAAVLALPAIAGWVPAPQDIVDGLLRSGSKGDVMNDASAVMKRDQAGVTLVAVANSNQVVSAVNLPANHCLVVAMPGDFEMIKSEVAHFAGVPMNKALLEHELDDDLKDSDVGRSAVIYAWRNEGGRHVDVSLAELSAMKPGDPISLVGASAQGPAAIIALIVPAK